MHVHVPSHRIRFLNPLSKSHYDFRPYIFPKGFNSLDFRVLQLGEEYVLDYSNHRTMFLDIDIDMKKVALSFLDSNGNDFVLLPINGCGDLAMFKASDQKWTNIEKEEGTLFGYDDVTLYKGKFYAVSTTGRTVVVGLDSEISEVGKPVSGSKKMFLVESKGELLLVAKYPSLEFEEDSSSAWTGRFRVYKLDEAGKKWIEVNNLDNCVLFMGINSAFAAPAEDLSVCRGNHIVFFNIFKPFGDWCVCVFDLENDSVGPLSKFPQLGKLFSLPSSWIFSRKLNAPSTDSMIWPCWFEAILMVTVDSMPKVNLQKGNGHNLNCQMLDLNRM
ncbi:hypothetical protein PTKIN_Ptkin10aG0166900 [Pterospermum kingtungense]